MTTAEYLHNLYSMVANLQCMGHTPECSADYIGDGLPCNCGHDEVDSGLLKLLMYYHEKDRKERFPESD